MCNRFDFFPICNKCCCGYVCLKGDKGDTGSQGIPGTNGIDGKSATIKIGTVSSGSVPMVTNSGTENEAVFDFVLVPGEKGETGPQGPKGEKGDTGATGPAGSGISAYSGGYNSSLQTFSFTSPNTPIQIKLDSPFPELNLTKSSNTFKIQQSGDYEIIYNLDVSSNKSISISTSVRKNNSIINSSLNTQQINVNQKNDGLFSGALISKLSAGDILDMAISVDSIPSGLSVGISNNANCSITIKKIG